MTPFTLVQTTEQLHELSQRLSAVTEFAVDLEVHYVNYIEVSYCINVYSVLIRSGTVHIYVLCSLFQSMSSNSFILMY